MKIAITAASGRLGHTIIKEMLSLGHDVIGLARSPEKVTVPGLEVRPGDYNDRDALERSLQGIDAMLLVSSMDIPEKRIGQHRNVIEAAKNAGVKKIVYTSIQGAETGTAFSPIVQSNRQTEEDIQKSGLDWAIGRNGIYIEPDIEYIASYKKAGQISNCAGDGRCGYTTRSELACAFARMLTQARHSEVIYNLHGEAITQYELAEYLGKAFDTELRYVPMSVEEYRKDRTAELGEFLGTIVAGIYQGIREGEADNPSHFALAAGREHESWQSFFDRLRTQ